MNKYSANSNTVSTDLKGSPQPVFNIDLTSNSFLPESITDIFLFPIFGKVLEFLCYATKSENANYGSY